MGADNVIIKATREMVSTQYSTYSRSLLPLLRQHGLTVVQEHEDLNEEQARYADRYFRENVYPVLTALVSRLA